MKNYFTFLCLSCLLSIHVQAQKVLVLTNKGTGNHFKISGNSEITFKLYDLQRKYTGWQLEKATDSSLIVSSYYFCNDSTTYSYNERELREIPFSKFEYYKFHGNGNAKMACGYGILIGGFLVGCSPLAAYDSEKKVWTPEVFYTTAAVGGVLLGTSIFVLKKILKRERYLDGKEWEMKKIN